MLLFLEGIFLWLCNASILINICSSFVSLSALVLCLFSLWYDFSRVDPSGNIFWMYQRVIVRGGKSQSLYCFDREHGCSLKTCFWCNTVILKVINPVATLQLGDSTGSQMDDPVSSTISTHLDCVTTSQFTSLLPEVSEYNGWAAFWHWNGGRWRLWF